MKVGLGTALANRAIGVTVFKYYILSHFNIRSSTNSCSAGPRDS